MPKQTKTTIQHAPTMTRRQRARWEEEQSQQRRVIFGAVGILGIVLLLIVGGFIWDRVLVPNRVVAQVGAEEISNAEYQEYRQISQVVSAYSNYATALQFAQYQQQQQFGGDTFQQQAVENLQALRERNPGVDYAILNRMVDERLVLQGTAEEGLAVADEELYILLAERFAPQPSPEMNPVPLTDTVELTGTDALSATVEPTATPEPTSAPTFEDARDQVDIALTNNYSELREFVENPRVDVAPTELPFTLDAYKAFVIRQQRIELLREQLGETLVSESEAPIQVVADVDQIFVEVPFTTTEEMSATLWAEGQARIEAIQADLAAGADFAALMETESDFDTAGVPAGPELQPITYWESLGITEPVSNQAVGVIGEPYRSNLGWHIVQVNERTEQADETALETLRTEAVDEWLQALRETITVQLFPEPTATPVPPTIDPALAPPDGAYPPPFEGDILEVVPTP